MKKAFLWCIRNSQSLVLWELHTTFQVLHTLPKPIYLHSRAPASTNSNAAKHVEWQNWLIWKISSCLRACVHQCANSLTTIVIPQTATWNPSCSMCEWRKDWYWCNSGKLCIVTSGKKIEVQDRLAELVMCGIGWEFGLKKFSLCFIKI